VTPPVRNASCTARFWLASPAAAATRTLPRTASHMPRYPTVAEKTAPTTKNTERPTRIPVLSAGRSSSRNGITTTNTASVRNWRRR